MRTGKLIGILILLVILSIFAVNAVASSLDNEAGINTQTKVNSNINIKNAKNDIITSNSDPISVEIKDLAFNPAQINVSKGTTVIWTNNDSVAHTVTSDTNVFDSGILDPGQTFEWTFNQSGTFKYHCKIHPFMTGTVIINETATMTATPTMTAMPTVTPNVIVTGTPTVTVTGVPETRRVVEIVDNMSGVPLINQSTMNILVVFKLRLEFALHPLKSVSKAGFSMRRYEF